MWLGSRKDAAGYQFGDSYKELRSNCLFYVQATEVGGTHPALVESIAYGNCVIANDVPEHREVLQDAGIYYHFNDFDDFNNMTIIDTGLSGVIYKVMFKVDYVQIVGDSIKPSGNREWNKRMTISVTDNFAEPVLYRNVSGDKERDTLTISFVNSYWFYN